jgi:hypothetical protein
MNNIIERKNLLTQRYGSEKLGVKEEVVMTGLPSFRYKSRWKKICLCLTNKNLRWYKPKRIIDDEKTWNFFESLHGTIPLIGLSLQLRTDQNGAKFIIIIDVRGNKYYIKGREDELGMWYDEICKRCKNLLLDIINSGSSIRVNCYAQEGITDGDNGYTIVSINKDVALFRFLLTKNVNEIPLQKIKDVVADETTFEIKFSKEEGSEQSIKFKTENSFGLADIFKYLNDSKLIPNRPTINTQNITITQNTSNNNNGITNSGSMTNSTHNIMNNNMGFNEDSDDEKSTIKNSNKKKEERCYS